ncbi:LysR substrate-binding domain-containing protein [Clostridium sp. AM58-1XD]|uniref:LysR family transcriptional regulator n=1 Tax=Clostridium sp. AM58-1XD TaxID=2292307 RepID=UPI000E48E183|nr:LysR substrate-binding domain-containing protein [Clostridium sp. AM58-1XD]RGY97605.1 LysR family transcriptional regulator [Clostridium sp. AM58-1XD]
MDLKKCEVLLKAVDYGSFSKVADELGYTPSAISHMMNSLDREVGFQLLVRGHSGVKPTDNCVKILPILRELIKWDNQLEQVVSEICGLETGTVTIGTYASISIHWLPRIIKAFQADYPHIKIRTMEGVRQELETWLDENRVDFCVYSYQPQIKRDWIPLKDDPMLAVLPPDHPYANKKSYPISACEGEPFIMPALGQDYDTAQLLREARVTPDISFSTMDNYSTISMIECGLGISIMNELITKGMVSNVVKKPLDPPRYITMSIALPSLEKASPAARKFIDYVKKMIVEI